MLESPTAINGVAWGWLSCRAASMIVMKVHRAFPVLGPGSNAICVPSQHESGQKACTILAVTNLLDGGSFLREFKPLTGICDGDLHFVFIKARAHDHFPSLPASLSDGFDELNYAEARAISHVLTGSPSLALLEEKALNFLRIDLFSFEAKRRGLAHTNSKYEVQHQSDGGRRHQRRAGDLRDLSRHQVYALGKNLDHESAQNAETKHESAARVEQARHHDLEPIDHDEGDGVHQRGHHDGARHERQQRGQFRTKAQQKENRSCNNRYVAAGNAGCVSKAGARRRGIN